MERVLSEELREEALLHVLSEDYEALYYVDFDDDSMQLYHMSEKSQIPFHEFFTETDGYEKAMTTFVEAIVAKPDREEMRKRAQLSFIREALKDAQNHEHDFRVDRKGVHSYYRFKISNLAGIGELHQAAVGFADVTQEMERVNKLLESEAMLDILERDSLTGLYTKEFFFKEVERYIQEHPEQDLVFWTSDVQGLKIINEKYGMEKGDDVLRTMSAGGKYFPGYLFGGRVEGDKLSALMLDMHENIEYINQKVQEGASSKFPVPNVVIKHGLYHIKKGNAPSVQGMYDRSILALQSVKNKYDTCVGEYDDKLRQDLLIHRQVMEDAGHALRDNQFQVYYQPKHNVELGRTGGAEALVRWEHPELGFMSPDIFIPLFEQNGFITKLDFYIWEEVCKSLQKWREEGLPMVPISVNVSRRDFEEPDLAEKIIALLDRYGVPHSQFHIEITESAYSDNPDLIVVIIKKLQESGFVIELDDFGTGYSSMTALSSLDLDVMKLDMSLVQNDIPGTDKNVLEFSMQLAKMMKLKTVAEGVETEEQAERIRSLGGDYIQGYLFSKPLPRDQFEEFIREENGKNR